MIKTPVQYIGKDGPIFTPLGRQTVTQLGLYNQTDTVKAFALIAFSEFVQEETRAHTDGIVPGIPKYTDDEIRFALFHDYLANPTYRLAMLGGSWFNDIDSLISEYLQISFLEKCKDNAEWLIDMLEFNRPNLKVDYKKLHTSQATELFR